jgi:RHS repeat-associated protein
MTHSGDAQGYPWGVYEEYWYDALGRRILKRSRHDVPLCAHPERCVSSIERHVWDGDQLLWELRQGSAGDIQNPSGQGTTGQTGSIGYVHAGGIDAPLGMVRNGTTIVLHQNWRGLYAFSTDVTGQPTTCSNPGGACAFFMWPGINWTLKQGYRDEKETQAWYGSLAVGHHDRTGLIYQRNRYYDSASGQFTQPDSIGIAGGSNLYGFANGDPVNFADPFGLCPWPPSSCLGRERADSCHYRRYFAKN